MTIRNVLFALSAAALLAPIAARADPPNDHDRDEVRRDRDDRGRRDHQDERWERGRGWGDRGEGYGGSGYQNGHYEQRGVSQWVDGHYDQIWVPGQCRRFGFWGRRVVCAPGHSEQQWVPGGYTQQQQWVWVPY